MYDELIVPLDDSDLTHSALGPALALSRIWGCPVSVISVVTRESETADRAQRLTDVAGKFGLGPDRVEVLQAGEPATGILARQPAGSALLCMSSRARGSLAEAVLGSVTEEVVRYATNPLLVVGPRADVGPDWSPKAVLACLDGSPTAETIVATATSWADSLGAELELVRVISPFGTGGSSNPEALATDQHEAAGYLPKLAFNLARGGKMPRWKSVGSPYIEQELVGQARTHEGCVLALTTHGRTGLPRLALGSTAMKVVHDAPCPVLIQRPPLSE